MEQKLDVDGIRKGFAALNPYFSNGNFKERYKTFLDAAAKRGVISHVGVMQAALEGASYSQIASAYKMESEDAVRKAVDSELSVLRWSVTGDNAYWLDSITS